MWTWGGLAAKTLRILCGDKVLANKLVGDGIVKALMSLIRTDDGTDPKILRGVHLLSLPKRVCPERASLSRAPSMWSSRSLRAMISIRGDGSAGVPSPSSNSPPATSAPSTSSANGILPCLITPVPVPEHEDRTTKFCGAALWSMTIKKRMRLTAAPMSGGRWTFPLPIPVLVHMLRT